MPRKNEPKRWPLPGYSAYWVELPFAVRSARQNGRVLTPSGRAKRYYRLINDQHQRRQMSIYTVAALAFHGQPPKNAPFGAILNPKRPIIPANIRWVSRSELARRSCGAKLSLWQRVEIVDEYWEGAEIDALTARYGISRQALNYLIRSARGKRDE